MNQEKLRYSLRTAQHLRYIVQILLHAH